MSRHFLALAARKLSARAMPAVRWAVLAFYAAMAVAFGLSFSYLASYYKGPAGAAQAWARSAQVWLFCSTAGYLAYRTVRALAKRFAGPTFDPARRRALNATGSALLAAPFALVGYGMFVERLDFRVREVEIPVDHLPQDLDGLRLLHLSDIHLSAFLNEKDLARVIDSANELHPHLALVTGDLITQAGDPLDVCLRQIARLRADAGILGCWGTTRTTPGSRTSRNARARGLEFRFCADARRPALRRRGAERGGRGLSANRPMLPARRRAARSAQRVQPAAVAQSGCISRRGGAGISI